MPRAVKGQRFGGRAKGIPNKATIEKALIAEREIEKAKNSGRKLAKEIMQEFLPVLAGICAYYQPTFPGMTQQNLHGNATEFERWYKHVLETAKALAPFESPTFRAIMVAPPPQQKQGQRVRQFTLTIFDEQRVQQMPEPRVIDQVPAET